MRATEAAEDAELSDFQRELVQLAAVLNGDHANPSIFPHALVDGMTVAEGAKYTQDAFKAFLKEAERCRNSGADDSHIVSLPAGDEEEGNKKEKKKHSWYTRWWACLACNQS